MVDSPNQTGQGFGWAVLFFGACWLFAAPVVAVCLTLANHFVAVLVLLGTLLWACICVGKITTDWSPQDKKDVANLLAQLLSKTKPTKQRKHYR
jgi:hypothetical protein